MLIFIYLYSGERLFTGDVVTGQGGVASHCQRVGLGWIVEKVEIFFMLPSLGG